jgi:hypothetical protein
VYVPVPRIAAVAVGEEEEEWSGIGVKLRALVPDQGFDSQQTALLRCDCDFYSRGKD